MCRLFFFFFFSVVMSSLYAVSKNGVRAVWITTAYCLDWPHDLKHSKEELIDMLDRFSDLNINTIMFQTRIRGDVVYDSKIEPRNYLFESLDYDPLDFVVRECHKRGMECHAWVVCMPLGSTKYVKRYGEESFIAKNKNIAMSYKGNWYMDPDKSGTASYLADLTGEIVSNYDVDGIHLDYIRYPDEYRNFPKSVPACDKAICRRDRITALVSSIYNKVKSVKPWVKLSCATIGKYTDTKRYPSRGWEALNGVGQDVERWISMGIIDMVYPMIYFRGNDFYPFLADWKERFGKDIVTPVLGIYRMDNDEGGWGLGEIESQLNFCKESGFSNIGMYRAEYLINNTKFIYPFISNNYFNDILIPKYVMSNENAVNIATPDIRYIEIKDDGLILNWEKQCYDGGIHYVLYGSNEYPVDINNSLNIIDSNICGSEYEYTFTYYSEQYRYYALTAVDRYGNESEPYYIKSNLLDKRYYDYVKNGHYIN